ncbi:RNA processing protein [Sporothrix epigloea]|uniref:LSM complex subunit LSM4 n=1 Tax=Sporothrix epigloea TaxID=1892477 RepID=A0ABP0DHU7_9PEZI
MLVELKNGETLNGHLVQCDTWMNLTLKEVVQTNAEGDSFMRIPEIYVKGNNIKYLRVPDEIIDTVKEQQQQQQLQHQHHYQSNFRGGRGDSRGGYQRGDGQGGRGGGRGDRGRGGSRGGRGRGRGD